MATSKKTAAPKPAAVKQPQDHAAKAEALGADITVVFLGQTYAITQEAVDDVELAELISDMTQNPILLPQVVRAMLGPDQWAKFKDTNRNEQGKVPLQRLSDLFTAMDDASGKLVASPTS